MTPGPHADVVVLGGGLAGLYAAFHAARSGASVILLEKEDATGGYHRPFRLGNNRFTLNEEAWSTRNPDLAGSLQEELPVDALAGEPPPENRLRWREEDERFPLRFRDFTRGIHGGDRFAALRSLPGIKLGSHRSSKPPKNAGEAFRQRFGKALYQEVFAADLERFWGIPPVELAPLVADLPYRMFLDLAAESEEPPAAENPSTPTDSPCWTLRADAEVLPQQLVKAIGALGGKIFRGAELVGLEARDGAITSVIVRDLLTSGGGDGEEDTLELEIPCSAVLSTIPLRALVRAFGSHAPAQIHASSFHLAHRPLHAYGCLVQRKRCLDHLTVHFRDRSFLRITEPGHVGQSVTPEDHTLLVIEIPESSAGASAVETWVKVVADLEAESICHRGEIVEQRLCQLPAGLPLFRLETPAHLDRILEFMGRIPNLALAGSAGQFSILPAADAMVEAAGRIDALKGAYSPVGSPA